MFQNLSKRAQELAKALFVGSEVENRIAAGVLRTILSDITRVYFESVETFGKGILVFNPEDPERSKFMSIKDMENDIALAQEVMNQDVVDVLERVIKCVEKESKSDVALVAMVQSTGISIHLIDSDIANERLDSIVNGLII